MHAWAELYEFIMQSDFWINEIMRSQAPYEGHELGRRFLTPKTNAFKIDLISDSHNITGWIKNHVTDADEEFNVVCASKSPLTVGGSSRKNCNCKQTTTHSEYIHGLFIFHITSTFFNCERQTGEKFLNIKKSLCCCTGTKSEREQRQNFLIQQ